MATIAELINSQQRSPVSYYAPRPSYSYQPPAASSRYTPPMMPSGGGGTSGWSNLEAFANTESGQKQIAQSQAPEGFDTGGFWGSPFGKGLGFVINNPVTRVITQPLNYLQMGGRAATLGVEELWKNPVTRTLVGGAAKSTAGPGVQMVLPNLEQIEADDRSNWSKVFSPNTTYGYGELLNQRNPSWLNNLAGLAGDVALDPFTYVGGGATRVAAGVSHVDEAARFLDEATNVLRLAEEAGDTKQIADATRRVAQAEDYVARAPAIAEAAGPNRLWELPMPRNRAERANLMGELSATPAGREFLAVPGAASQAGLRGFQTLSPELKAMLNISEPGLRLRGFNTKIPGTGKIAQGLNVAGGATRAGIARLPGGNIRTPKGLEDAYSVLTRGSEGDVLLAGTDVWLRNQIRVGSGQQLARGNRILSNSVKEFFKGKSKDAIRQMVREAETSADPNDVNKIGARLIELFQKVTGREIDPAYLRNPATYFPHLLDPKARRYLQRLRKQGSKAADDFMRHAGLLEDDLLEDPRFYNDNMLEGSGFLEKARAYGLDKDGNAQTFNIGGTEVTFEADDLDHINEQLRKAFPNFKGDFYDTDPVRVFEAYNKSLSRQAGRDVAQQELRKLRAADLAAGKPVHPMVDVLEGDLDLLRQQMNTALSQQGNAPLLATAQGKYDPTQPLPPIVERPVVAGSADDRARIATIEAIEKELAAAESPEEFAAAGQRLVEAPAPAERPGGIDPNKYFSTTKGEVATQALEGQAKRAKTYATAAAAEVKEAETKLRQGIYDLRDIVVTPLRTTVAETKKQISALNKKLRTWGKTIKDLGPLTVDTQDEMTALHTNIEATIANAETKLKRTASSLKGRATRRQRQAEAALRKELEDMYALRARLREKIDSGPATLAQEIRDREEMLNQPVREANEALLRAEMQWVRDHPIPHNQATVDGAMAALESELGRGVDPEELLARFRGVIDDIHRGASAVRGLAMPDNPEAVRLRDMYASVLDEIEAIGKARRYRGKLTKESQRLMDDAMVLRNRLRIALGSGTDLAGNPLAAHAPLSEFDEAKAALMEARDAVTRAEAAPTSATIKSAADLTPEMIEQLKKGEFKLEDLGKGEGVGDLPRLRAERDRLARQFRPGGKFHEEQKARDILMSAEDWAKGMDEATKDAQRGVEDAVFRRSRTQESIIWKRRPAPETQLEVVEPTPGETLGALPKIAAPESANRAGNRYVTKVGAPKSTLEQMGRGVNEKRFVEPIPLIEGGAPQPEAWLNVNPQPVFDPAAGLLHDRGTGLYIDPRTELMYDIDGERSLGRVKVYDPVEREWGWAEPPNQGGLWRSQPIPSPRTEAEAIQSLKSLQQTGGPQVMGARGEMQALTPQIAEAERALPEKLTAAQTRIAMEEASKADQTLGPLAAKVQTYKNLASDVADKQKLVTKRDEAAALNARLKANPTNKYTDIDRTLDEIEAVAKANPYLDDPKMTQVESLLQSHRAEAERIDETKLRIEDLDRVADDASNGKLGNVMIVSTNNNWRALHNGPLNTGDMIMDAELYKRFTNLFEISRQPKLLGRTFNAFTNLFKTYATLTPGFFVRNAIGGIFMNTADGVKLTAQLEGAEKWKEYMDGGEEWLEQQPRRVQEAIAAATASGAGGRFEEAGVLAKTESRFYNFLSSNRATRWGQRKGTYVEGAMRLGMALDSIDNGMGVQGALQRITRVHFDYTQVSQIDETMKRIIPFWTFMSRNLPLQIQEMWTNPRVYSYYDHLVQNFSLPDEEFTPDYWTRQGAWRTPVSIGGNPLYMQPDLGFTRVQSDIQLMSDALSGENFGGLFAQANPAIGATLDFMNKRDSFYNRSFDPNTDYTKQTGVLGAPITLLAKALNQTNDAGQVSDNFLNYLQSMIPPLSQATRLFPGATGQESSEQTWAKRARYAGFPIQLLTPDAQDSEYWRQWRAMQDEADAQRAMIREAVS